MATPAFVPFNRFQKTRDRAVAALLAGETCLVVTGPAGAGKTVLLDQIARLLRSAGWDVGTQLAAAPAIGMAAQDGDGALLVDEADRLSREQIAAIRAGRRPVVFAGLDTLAQRIPDGTRLRLDLLSPEEAYEFIGKWLAAAKRPAAFIDPAAAQAASVLSGGVPRLLGSMLGAAAWLADGADVPAIGTAQIEEAAELRACFSDDGSEAAPGALPRRRRMLLPAMAVMLVLGASGFAAARAYPSETARLLDEATTMAVTVSARVGTMVTAALEPVLHPAPHAPIAAAKPDALPAAAPVAAEEAPAETTPVVVAPPPQAAAPVAEAQPEPIVLPPPTTFVARRPAPPAEAAPTVPAAPVRPSAAPATIPGATVDLLLRRGREMVAIGDISAARLLFSRVAEAGNSEGMVALGRTYDPAVLGAAGILQSPDPAQAARWYDRAAELGNEEAASLRHQLKGVPLN